jgi:hypothetical protein
MKFYILWNGMWVNLFETRKWDWWDWVIAVMAVLVSFIVWRNV